MTVHFLRGLARALALLSAGCSRSVGGLARVAYHLDTWVWQLELAAERRAR